MELFKIGFLTIRLIDVLDIAIVTFLVYRLFEFVRTTFPSRIIIFIISIFILWRLVDVFKFRLLSAILAQVWGVGTLAFIILFAPELRRILNQFADRFNFQRLLEIPRDSVQNHQILIDILIQGLSELQAMGDGALILVQGQEGLSTHIQQAERLDANCTPRLLVSIFQKNSPLHDGAVIIEGKRILFAGSILPISRDIHLEAHVGTRHRAAMGISEVSDCFAIVLSEENGNISFAQKGQLSYNCTPQSLEAALNLFLNG